LRLDSSLYLSDYGSKEKMTAMSYPNRKIVFWLYLALSLLSETFILWLFPFTGLGGLICWPITILLSLGLGYLLYLLTKMQFNLWSIALLFSVTLIFQTYIELLVVPQDFGGNAISKISYSYKAYKNYDSIQFKDFANLTQAERVDFIYKFKNKLPDSFIILTLQKYDGNDSIIISRDYIIENRKSKRIYDTSKIKIIENDTATIIIENPNKINKQIHTLDANFLNTTGGGFDDNGLLIDVVEDDFKLKTGIEKLFSGILKLTKRR
jgi:hypothetical protein